MAPSHQLPRRRQSRRLGHWVALAILIHAELALVIGLVFYFWAPRNAELAELARRAQGPESIEISTVDDETARKILAELEREQEKAEEEKTKKEVESADAPGQVVELPKPREEKRPENARFAAEHDSAVEKETKKYGRFDQKARQGDRAGEDEVSSREAPPAPPTGETKPASPGAIAMRSPGKEARPPVPGVEGPPGPPSATPTGEALAVPEDPEGTLAPAGGAQRPIPGSAPTAGQTPSPPGSPGLVPSQNQLSRAIGSGTQDHLKDIDDGDETALNAKKWKFASFFNRVKQQVRDHWRPAEEYGRRDPTGSIYGKKDRYTLLRVQLKPDGTLANVALELPSGIEFLDDVAIEAFKQAQPFPNPPRQLVEQGSGLINFRFGFFFELSGAPKMRVFRYNSM